MHRPNRSELCEQPKQQSELHESSMRGSSQDMAVPHGATANPTEQNRRSRPSRQQVQPSRSELYEQLRQQSKLHSDRLCRSQRIHRLRSLIQGQQVVLSVVAFGHLEWKRLRAGPLTLGVYFHLATAARLESANSGVHTAATTQARTHMCPYEEARAPSGGRVE